jgi:RHS repeat-associated protein
MMRHTSLVRRLAMSLLLGLGLIAAAVPGRAALPGQPIANPELARAALHFEEPLVPSGPTTVEEDADLTAAIARYRATSTADDVSALEGYLAAHPGSGWRLALLTNLGLTYYHNGYFAKATEAFAAAWRIGEPVAELHAKALTDRAAGELLRLHARLGHADDVAALLAQMDGRGMSGQATERRDGAKEALWEMRNNPGVAYLCGPMALKNLLLAGGATRAQVSFLDAYRSGPNGVSLAEVGRLATQAKLPFRLVHRTPGQPVPVPSVVHWKVNHFAAILGERGGHYEIADPTFGGPRMWVSRAAIDAEASGFFLVPNATSQSPWRDATADEAARVHGMGTTGDNDPSTTGPKNCPCQGMAQYSFTEMVVSLGISDQPVGYTPPKGPPVPVQITYNQREASQPANFSFFNVSAKWSLNWLAYVQDDPTNPGANVTRVTPGGGYIAEAGYNSATGGFTPEIYDSSVLSLAASGSAGYTLSMPDGSVEIYAASNGATSYPRYLFLSSRIDAHGNAINLSYDSQMRLNAITDATGRATTFQYANTNFPLQVTQISDPFGRSATLAYNASGQLSSITDVLGLVSSFSYDGSGLVNALTTPYGTTTFVYGDNGNSRYLQATDPLGYTERVEFVQGAPNVPFNDPVGPPQGITDPFNEYISSRDTFYWDKHAFAVAAGNYPLSRNRHWAHMASNINVTSNTVESIKYPFENRIWYNYPGQQYNEVGAGQSGSLLLPTTIARVLGDGTSQTKTNQYNSAGNLTYTSDPVGRVTIQQYAANQIDITSVQQVTGNGTATLASFTYNSQHLPLTATDAAGQTTTYTYNPAGQVTSVTDALGEVTTYSYNALGYRTGVTNANNQTAVTFTYDSFGRVATYTDSQGFAVNYTYDALDRVTQETFLDGTSRRYVYTNLDQTSVTDRQGRTTIYAYDADRNLIGVTDPLGNVTQYSYYENGKLKTLTDSNGHVTTWGIDLENRLTSKTDPNGNTTTYAYENTTSRLASVTDALGQVKQYGYAQDDRLATMQYANAINPTAPVFFADDPYFVRRVAMTDGNGTTTYSYNAPGTRGALKLAQESPPFANSSITYGYDALGRLVARSVGGDGETFAYDKLGRLSSHSDDLGTFTRAYLGQTGQLTSELRGAIGTEWLYGNNLADLRLAKIVNLSGASQFSYTTTAEGDVTAISQTINPQTWTYSYDQADRLTAAKSSLGTGYGYGYDSASNLVNIATPAGNSTVTPTATNAVATAGIAAFSYDANGNLLADYARSYAWDAENRLIGIAGSGYTTAISYDGLGRRTAIATTSGGVAGVLHYGWCGQTLCQERSSGDVPMRRYLLEGEYDSVQGGLVYQVDHLGSVRDVVAVPRGVRTNHFDYDAYGNPTSTTGSAATWTDFRYAGLFYHQASGLYLATYRAYDPSLGRWLSRDPIAEEGGLNLYGYVAGNPLQFNDSLGFLSPGGYISIGYLEAALAEILGGGPEDPAADLAAAAAIRNGYLQAALAAAAEAAAQAAQDAAQRQDEYDAYKRRCNEPPPPGLDPCDLARWKLSRNQDCRNMRQDWDNKWQPGRHDNDIANLDRSIQNLKQWIAQNCPGAVKP